MNSPRLWLAWLLLFLVAAPAQALNGLNLPMSAFSPGYTRACTTKSFRVDCPINKVDPSGLQGESAFGNFGRYVFGLSMKKHYGPETQEVEEMRNAPGLNAAHEYYKEKNVINRSLGAPDVEVIDDGRFGKFGVYEFYDATVNNNSTRHFVGSYSVDIIPIEDGKVQIIISDSKNAKSLFYRLTPESWNVEFRANWTSPVDPNFQISRPFSVQRQIYEWTEPAPKVNVSAGVKG